MLSGTRTRLLMLLMLLAVPAQAETVAFARVYIEPWTTLTGVPLQQVPMLGSFGVRHEGEGRLRLTSTVESKMTRDIYGFRTIASIFYNIGAKLDIGHGFTIEVAHGSWHNVDRQGDAAVYNYLGLEMKL